MFYFVSLYLLWSFSHILLKLTRTWQWEDYNVMYIPSASLGQRDEAVNGGQRIASSSMQGAEDGWETKPRYDIFDQNTTAKSAHLFQVSSVLHTIIFLRKKLKRKGGLGQEEGWKMSTNSGFATIPFLLPMKKKWLVRVVVQKVNPHGSLRYICWDMLLYKENVSDFDQWLLIKFSPN